VNNVFFFLLSKKMGSSDSKPESSLSKRSTILFSDERKALDRHDYAEEVYRRVCRDISKGVRGARENLSFFHTHYSRCEMEFNEIVKKNNQKKILFLPDGVEGEPIRDWFVCRDLSNKEWIVRTKNLTDKCRERIAGYTSDGTGFLRPGIYEELEFINDHRSSVEIGSRHTKPGEGKPLLFQHAEISGRRQGLYNKLRNHQI
jgi:hypothetical protein